MSPKILAAVALGLAAVGILYVSLSNLGDSLVYYWTPTELVAAGDKAVGADVRLGGMVDKGSIQFDRKAMDLRFTLTEGEHTISVHGSGMPPQMFREGIGVVVQGTMTEAGVFESDRLLVKHDNQYKAPEEGRTPDMETMMKSVTGGDS